MKLAGQPGEKSDMLRIGKYRAGKNGLTRQACICREASDSGGICRVTDRIWTGNTSHPITAFTCSCRQAITVSTCFKTHKQAIR